MKINDDVNLNEIGFTPVMLESGMVKDVIKTPHGGYMFKGTDTLDKSFYFTDEIKSMRLRYLNYNPKEQ